MSEEISYELYKWLSSVEALPPTLKYKTNGNYQVDPRTAQNLLNGTLILPLLRHLASTHSATINEPLLSSVKQSSTPAARMYNWNILSESLLKLNFTVAKNDQKEITSGNFHSLTRLLLQLHQRFNLKRADKKEKDEGQGELNLKKLQVIQSFDEAQSFLQLVVVILSDRLSLTPKQAVSTLSDNAKYYAHMVVKGVKNSFQDILSLLDAFYVQLPKLVEFAEKDPEKNTQFLLDLFKPTLISRQSDVARMGAKLMLKLTEESQRYNTKNLVYQILCKESVGFDFLYMALKRHPDLSQPFAQFIFPLVRHALPDFFEVHLRKTIKNQQQYIKVLLRLQEGFGADSESKTALRESGLLKIWLQNCQKALGNKRSRQVEPINEQTKILHLEFLCNLWKNYSSEIDQQQAEQMLVKGINQLKKYTRRDIYTVKIPALIRLFDFLHFLADTKNKMAAVLYKKLIFLLIENHQQPEVRQIILQNFSIVLRKYPTIPVEFLLDPLLKQLINSESKSYVLNIFDFDFLEQVCRHQRMDAVSALSYLEYFSKLYIKSFIYAHLTRRLIDILTRRFCEEQTIIQFIKKVIESTLNQYGVLTFNKKKAKKEEHLANKQRQSLSIELVKLFIQLEHQDLRDFILTNVTGLYLLWLDTKKHDNKGLRYLIQLFGDLEELCLQYNVHQSNKSYRQRPSQQLPNDSQFSNYKPTPKSQAYREQQYMKQKGIGYRDRTRGNKTHADSLLEVAAVKPAPRALEQIERIKERLKDGANKKKEKEVEQLHKLRQRNSVNTLELMQRNLSLGYTKVVPKMDDQIIFDFNSVKAKQLKHTNHFHRPEELQEIDMESTDVILKRHQKDIKALYLKYALISSTTESNRKNQPSALMSFTEVIKMLNEKGLAFVNKLVVSDIISSINHHKRREKNILYGIEEVDFPQFLLKLTDHLIQYQQSAPEVPFGIRLQRLLKTLFSGQNFFENRFRVKEDPKILELRESLMRGQKTAAQIPEGYRKVKQTQVQLLFEVPDMSWGLSERYKIGYELADWLLHKCLGFHIITPMVSLQQNFNLIQIPKGIKVGRHESQKRIESNKGTIQESGEGKEQKISATVEPKKVTGRAERRSHSQRIIKTKTDPAVLAQQQKMRSAKRQKYVKQLNKNLQRLRQEKKKKEEMQKKDEALKKQQAKKKQDLRKEYLDSNKKKILERKAKEQEEQRERKENQKKSKEGMKTQLKKKEHELLEKRQEEIQKYAQKINDKKRTLESSRQKRLKPVAIPKQTESSAENDKIKMLEVKNSLQNGSLSEVVSEYDKQFTDLFQAYWVWEQKRIDLKGIALMLKDFKVSPEFIMPKNLADTYKGISRGQPLDYSNFIECLTKCSFRSPKLTEEVGSEDVTADVLRSLCDKLRMKEFNFKEVLHNTKNHLE